ncbi:unnamed protein product [Nezara viridula]|uniref:Neuropeptide n=1 Tax=Nezara viridula TaxID=85310 RepID=A0A9P0H5J1_NEZVI|nr:unnamed protein product [Nezara viridula]
MCRGCPPIILGGLTLILSSQRQGIASSVAEPWMCRGCPPIILGGLPILSSQRQGIASSVAEPWMCRGCPPIILGGLTLSYPRNVRGLPPRLQSPGCVGVVPLSFLAVFILSSQRQGIASSVAEPWMCRGCPPIILGGLTLSYPILATSGDCLLGCRALDV